MGGTVRLEVKGPMRWEGVWAGAARGVDGTGGGMRELEEWWRVSRPGSECWPRPKDRKMLASVLSEGLDMTDIV